MNEPKLCILIESAQNGDREALMQLINRFMPLIKKHSHRIADDEATLILRFAEAVKRYYPNTTYGQDELRRPPEPSQK